VYLAPLKSLCAQMTADWTRRLGAVGIRCVELTGDTEELPDLATCDVVLTTPEKWDAVTRRRQRGAERARLLGELGLVAIDEIHTVGTNRGATLEAVVSRMKALRPALRFIALSATIPNAEDIAAWLDAPRETTFQLGHEFRPVPVSVHVLGFPPAQNDFLFDRKLAYRLAETIAQYGTRGRPSLVFCSSRKGAVQAAQQLVKDSDARALVASATDAAALEMASMRVADRVLGECVRRGVGFHTAGCAASDRAVVEALFAEGRLQVLCTTSTLSQGVNFPAHLVVVKSTRRWVPGRGYEELDDIDVLQMIGRAGRPQFDASGVAVVMTSTVTQRHWQNVAQHERPAIESTLLG
jgi:ATP-dependent DNA helicase HFM1/MER3